MEDRLRRVCVCVGGGRNRLKFVSSGGIIRGNEPSGSGTRVFVAQKKQVQNSLSKCHTIIKLQRH
jgi:hypothetical protein